MLIGVGVDVGSAEIVECLKELVGVHTVDGAGLFDALSPGGRAAQTVHSDLKKEFGGGGIRVENIADDAFFGHDHVRISFRCFLI